MRIRCQTVATWVGGFALILCLGSTAAAQNNGEGNENGRGVGNGKGNNSDNGNGWGRGRGSNVTFGAPELSPTAAAAGLAMLSGGILVLRGRRARQ